MFKLNFNLVIAFFALFCLCQASQAQPAAAGQVMLASGKLEAQAPNQPARLLKRGSPFYTSDTLNTDADGQAQLRFTDGTLVALRPNSAFRIDHYQFANDQQNNKKAGAVAYTVSLLKGGFRSISGQVAKADPSQYKIDTNVATIGVRGTEFSLMLDNAGGLGAATYKGRIHLSNSAGSIEIGQGAEYNYAYVASKYTAPKGKPVLPVFMLQDLLITDSTESAPPTDDGVCLH